MGKAAGIAGLILELFAIIIAVLLWVGTIPRSDSWLQYSVPVLLAGGITLNLLSFRTTPVGKGLAIFLLICFLLLTVLLMGYLDFGWFAGFKA